MEGEWPWSASCRAVLTGCHSPSLKLPDVHSFCSVYHLLMISYIFSRYPADYSCPMALTLSCCGLKARADCIDKLGFCVEELERIIHGAGIVGSRAPRFGCISSPPSGLRISRGNHATCPSPGPSVQPYSLIIRNSVAMRDVTPGAQQPDDLWRSNPSPLVIFSPSSRYPKYRIPRPYRVKHGLDKCLAVVPTTDMS